MSHPHPPTPLSLQGFDDQCLGFIASRLSQAAFMSGEVIFERGERGDEMFLIAEGTVVLYAGQQPMATIARSDSALSAMELPKDGGGQGGPSEAALTKSGAVDLAAGERIAGKGDVIGEGALFPEELGPLRLESAMALSFVSAFVLTAASMREIEAEYPAVRFPSAPLEERCPVSAEPPDVPLPADNPAAAHWSILRSARLCSAQPPQSCDAVVWIFLRTPRVRTALPPPSAPPASTNSNGGVSSCGAFPARTTRAPVARLFHSSRGDRVPPQCRDSLTIVLRRKIGCDYIVRLYNG